MRLIDLFGNRRRLLAAWVGLWILAVGLVAILAGDRAGGLWAYAAVLASSVVALLPAAFVVFRRHTGWMRIAGAALISIGVATSLLVAAVLIGSQSYFKAWSAFERDAGEDLVWSYVGDYLRTASDAGMHDGKSDKWPVVIPRGILLDRRSEMLFIAGRLLDGDGPEPSSFALANYSHAAHVAESQGDTAFLEFLEEETGVTR